jgi:hypothetical protein
MALLISCAERLAGRGDLIVFRADPQDVITFLAENLRDSPVVWGNAFLARVLILAITPSNERFA